MHENTGTYLYLSIASFPTSTLKSHKNLTKNFLFHLRVKPSDERYINSSYSCDLNWFLCAVRLKTSIPDRFCWRLSNESTRKKRTGERCVLEVYPSRPSSLERHLLKVKVWYRQTAYTPDLPRKKIVAIPGYT